MIIPVILGLGVFALVVLWRVSSVIKNHVAYYLPPVAIGALSKELQSSLAASQAVFARVSELVNVIDEQGHDLERSTALFEMLGDRLQTVIERKASEWLSEQDPDLMEDLIRRASSRVASNIQQGLIDRTTKLGGEYVLLQCVDDLTVEVNLEARYTSPEDIRKALKTILLWTPAKAKEIRNERDLADWFMQQTKSSEELKLMLGKLGVALQELRWQGSIALKKGEKLSQVAQAS